MPSNYANLEVQHASYFPTPQAYNTNVVDRSHDVMHVLPSYVISKVISNYAKDWSYEI
jgi:hypothetical protein